MANLAGRMGISRAAVESSNKVMEAVKQGKIKKHLMGNNSPVRYGATEKKDMTEYCEFVKSKLCCDMLNLTGRPPKDNEI